MLVLGILVESSEDFIRWRTHQIELGKVSVILGESFLPLKQEYTAAITKILPKSSS
jgi:hypothetical protein